MTQYFFTDESGDTGLDGQASSSSHFVIAMLQLAERTPLSPLADLRKQLSLSLNFEFKYHKTTNIQKDLFFNEVTEIPFRARIAVLNKTRAGRLFDTHSSHDMIIEILVGLTLRASELDISNDILIVDGATPAFRKNLRVKFSERCKLESRIRPFKNIIGADSKNEDGLQLADMIAGAVRVHAMGTSSRHFRALSQNIVDLWNLP
ncbi:MAG: DUF3800 domain-containing protein [Anaerolineales bacterium]|jgi:hypothetical protein|nr:DUF3800 domain-containing protein [Anaerolineales bacterium]